MKDNKRYYWIKLKTDFFNQSEIDFLLAQPNGCEYVVLYQMLCLQTVNQKGKLGYNFGEIMVPYDIAKIVRDTKYFDEDIVKVGLELFKKLHLIYLEEDACLKIADIENIVGSEKYEAKRKRDQREKNNLLGQKEENSETENGTSVGTDTETEIRIKDGTVLGHCPTEIDIEIEKDIELEKEKREEDDENEKIEIFKNEIDEKKAIKEKARNVLSFCNEKIENECLEYLNGLSPGVIIYTLEKAG